MAQTGRTVAPLAESVFDKPREGYLTESRSLKGGPPEKIGTIMETARSNPMIGGEEMI